MTDERTFEAELDALSEKYGEHKDANIRATANNLRMVNAMLLCGGGIALMKILEPYAVRLLAAVQDGEE